MLPEKRRRAKQVADIYYAVAPFATTPGVEHLRKQMPFKDVEL